MGSLNFNRSNFIILFMVYIVSIPFSSFGRVPDSIEKPKKRILRMCCAFGSNVKLFGIPFIRVDKIMSINDLGNHSYLGGKTEGNGIIYSKKAGFLDLGHIRDQADWTAFLYKILVENVAKGPVDIKLGHELGDKLLKLDLPINLSEIELINIASSLAFQLSTWHEIASWYGATRAPILNEKFSSFSFEDNFSNALGVSLGKEALLSTLSYNKAMDSLLTNYLLRVEASDDKDETRSKMFELVNTYWNPKKSIPNKKLIIKRNFEIKFPIKPIVFEGLSNECISIFKNAKEIKSYSQYAFLEFHVGYRFPYKRLFPEKTTRIIICSEFDKIIDDIKTESLKLKKTNHNR